MKKLAIIIILLFAVSCASTPKISESYTVISHKNFDSTKISRQTASVVVSDSVAVTSSKYNQD